jgi:hypothetical protein
MVGGSGVFVGQRQGRCGHIEAEGVRSSSALKFLNDIIVLITLGQIGQKKYITLCLRHLN